MATIIKPIEAKSVHQIQSGQVIVDLCSVIKELVENALDAAATSIEVRFRNNGLDAIEVQDNGPGIAEANYESVGLKHYTSKLYSYAELSTLNTFGFRGEALSSLCALSTLSIVTAQAHEAPKGKRLDFETSGKLKSAILTAAQKGTTVFVEDLFGKLPVRRKELTKNIKREYGKVIGLLHAYACISTGVKFTVKNTLSNGKSTIAFSTKANATTRENIANVYSAKMLSQLIELDLNLDFASAFAPKSHGTGEDTKVRVEGHISKPIFGEGRQTPDRQMVFVNGRPCGLPQILKAINEVYKSFNVSQSPFIFANFRMNTEAYDVNVSPDKRTIFLHSATALTESLQAALTKLFDRTEQSLPQSQMRTSGAGLFRKHGAKDPNTIVEDEQSEVDLSHLERLERPRLEADQDEADSKTADNSRPPLINLPARSSPRRTTRTTAADTSVVSTASSPSLKVREAKTGANTPQAGRTLRQVIQGLDGFKNSNAPTAAAPRSDNGVDEGDEEAEEEDDDNEEEGAEEDIVAKYHVPDFNDFLKHRGSKRRLSPDGVPSDEDTRHLADDDRPGRLNQAQITVTTDENDTPPHTGLVVIARADRLSPEPGTAARITRELPDNTERSPSQHHTQPSTATSVQARTPLIARSPSVFQSNDASEEGSHHSPALKNESSNSEDLPGEVPEAVNIDPFSEGIPPGGAASTSPTRPTHNAKRARAADDENDEATVRELIELAETSAPRASETGHRRLKQALKGSSGNNATVGLVVGLNTSYGQMLEQYDVSQRCISLTSQTRRGLLERERSMDVSEEERLSLAISKKDFASMRIAGQFNLGFIVAVRVKDGSDRNRQRDEVFIVDQHASDEIYNFERLQNETVVSNQRLVHPIRLDLTAVEEEIVLENAKALEKNGFILDNDLSGQQPIGHRCRLVSLPLSKEVVFGERDLEELIHLLSEAHVSSASSYTPRPSKVRKMFAMRACRSSVMIGKTLSHRQMSSLLQHMGTIDKPWNCPHGRPTMRHLTSLDEFDIQVWREGDGVFSDGSPKTVPAMDVWKQYAALDRS